MYQHIKVPAKGEKITVNKDFSLNVPANPIIPFIEGDGTGVDITPVMRKVVDAAVNGAYGASARSSGWKCLPGKNPARSMAKTSGCRRKPSGRQGIRGLDQRPADHAGGRRNPLDQCRLAPGTRSVCLPASGALFQGRTQPAQASGKNRHGDLPREFRRHLCRHRVGGGDPKARARSSISCIKEMGVKKIRFPQSSGIGIKPVSREGTERLVRKAIQYAIDQQAPSR